MVSARQISNTIKRRPLRERAGVIHLLLVLSRYKYGLFSVEIYNTRHVHIITYVNLYAIKKNKSLLRIRFPQLCCFLSRLAYLLYTYKTPIVVSFSQLDLQNDKTWLMGKIFREKIQW